MKLFWCQVIFSVILISKMDVKINLMMMTKSYAADTGTRFPTKSILKPFGLTGPCRQRWSQYLGCRHESAIASWVALQISLPKPHAYNSNNR